METKPDTILFKESKIRYVWDEELEEYYFSVINVVGVLSESKNPRDYWYRLKKCELENGVDLSTYCRQLKLKANDGKLRKTDVATKKQLFRIIQLIPSPNAEPFSRISFWWTPLLYKSSLVEIVVVSPITRSNAISAA